MVKVRTLNAALLEPFRSSFSSVLENTMIKHIIFTRQCNIHVLLIIFYGCQKDSFRTKTCHSFCIFAKNMDFWYSLESPQLGGSKEYP